MNIEIGDVIEWKHGYPSRVLHAKVTKVNADSVLVNYVLDDDVGGMLCMAKMEDIINVYSLKKPKRVKGFETTWHNNIVQGTSGWLKLREGMISASRAGVLMVGELGRNKDYLKVVNSEKSGTFGKGALTYLNSKVDELRGVAKGGNSKKTEAMQHGNLMEDKSRKLYEINSGNKTYETGFVATNEYYIGVSPDAVCEEGSRCCEIKNFYPEKISKIIETGKIPSECYAQMQMQMLVMDFDWCDFVLTNFYDKSTPEYTCIPVARDEEYCKVLRGKLIMADKYIREQAVVQEDASLDWLLK